jgi:hypothetical protein
VAALESQSAMPEFPPLNNDRETSGSRPAQHIRAKFALEAMLLTQVCRFFFDFFNKYWRNCLLGQPVLGSPWAGADHAGKADLGL